MIESIQDGHVVRWYSRTICGSRFVAAFGERGALISFRDVSPEPGEPITGDDRYAFLSAVPEFLRNPGGEPGEGAP